MSQQVKECFRLYPDHASQRAYLKSAGWTQKNNGHWNAPGFPLSPCSWYQRDAVEHQHRLDQARELMDNARKKEMTKNVVKKQSTVSKAKKPAVNSMVRKTESVFTLTDVEDGDGFMRITVNSITDECSFKSGDRRKKCKVELFEHTHGLNAVVMFDLDKLIEMFESAGESD